MYPLYNLIIKAYGFGIALASLYNEKAFKWRSGRKGLLESIRTKPKDKKTIWFHCASLGEFEQGRPILDALSELADSEIILSFFSPSGYELRRDYSKADHVYYLPLDTASNAKAFISAIDPDFVVFVKYEFWLNHLRYLREQSISTILISAVFTPNNAYQKYYGSLFKETLDGMEAIFVQDADSAERIKKISSSPVLIAGDSRVDRVSDIAKNAQALPALQDWSADHKIWVIGSNWPEDDAVLVDVIKHLPKKWKCIIAAHDVSEKNIKAMERLFPKSQRWSNFESSGEERILIIDRIGLLAQLYQYARIAYVGGGFGKGIHNTLEPAAYGIPVIFGPRYHKFNEARDLIQLGGAFSIERSAELSTILQGLEEEASYIQSCKAVQDYIKSSEGASHKIIDFIRAKLSI